MKTFPHDSIEMIELTEIEELILFMLIADYSQQEIAQTLKCSRKQVVEIISESLCVKFELPILSTALLIDKAIAKGYNMVIPRLFFNYYQKAPKNPKTWSETVASQIQLTESEELILFMLIYGYSISEIANYQGQSLNNISIIIQKQLYKKFDTISTINLIKKADFMGYSIVMPNAILKADYIIN